MRKEYFIQKIINIVCKDYRITRDDFDSERKFEMLVEARTMACVLMKKFLKMTYKDIAQVMNKTYPTIISNVKKMTYRLNEKETYIYNRYQRIIYEFNKLPRSKK